MYCCYRRLFNDISQWDPNKTRRHVSHVFTTVSRLGCVCKQVESGFFLIVDKNFTLSWPYSAKIVSHPLNVCENNIQPATVLSVVICGTTQIDLLGQNHIQYKFLKCLWIFPMVNTTLCWENPHQQQMYSSLRI